MARLEVRVEQGVFFFSGEFDMTCEDTFDAWLPKLCQGPGPVVLDLRDLAFIDSTGIRGVLRIMAERPVVVRNAREPVRRVFEITGLEARPEITFEG